MTTPFTASIASLDPLAPDIVRLVLEFSDDVAFSYRAGQYADLDLGDAVLRSFSIANAPQGNGQIEFHIRTNVPELNGVLANIGVGSAVAVSGPLGQLQFRPTTRNVVMVAGGTGFAPIKAMIEDALSASTRAASIHLYWGARTVADLYMRELPQDWQRTVAGFKFTPVLSGAGEDDDWSGHTGWVHQVVLAEVSDLANVDLYVAGPPPMVIGLRDLALENGLPAKQFMSDFGTLD